MSLKVVCEYASEGAPLLVADVESAALWRGTEDDGSGVVVEYGCGDQGKLPQELLQTKKQGAQSKKFKTLAEARTFADKFIAACKAVHPTAAPLPRYPDRPFYYIGSENIFSVELHYTSAFDAMLKRLKKDVQSLVIDTKRKASALFFDQQGGGPGVIAIDRESNCLVVTKFDHQPPPTGNVEEALRVLKPAPSKETLGLSGKLVIFDAAHSATELSLVNWQSGDFSRSAQAAFAKAESGPLSARDQRAPCGAFAHLAKGKYAASHKADVDVAGASARVLWVRMTG
jgi:hypothetical protein